MKSKFISVCKNVIGTNNKTIREGLDRPIIPPIRIQNGKSGDKVTCNTAVLRDSHGEIIGKIHYQPDKAIINSGAKVVIEYFGDIEVVD
jgi:hypothetical protein